MLSANDRRDLQWLEIGHYVAAGFALLWTVLAWFVADRMDGFFTEMQSAPQAAAVRDFAKAARIAGIVLQASFVITLALAGVLIRQRAGYRTCFVLSIWNLLFMPFGTVAGVFTFVLLRRPGIESAFRGIATASAGDLSLQRPQENAHQRPPPAFDPTRTATDLSPLPVLHYALAALTFVFGSLPLLHVGLGLAVLLNPDFGGRIKGNDARAIGSLFLGVGLIFVVTFWTAATAIGFTGRFISQRRRRSFCLVVSAVICMFFPLGTALGAYTLIVLNRDHVKAAFLGPPGPA